MPILISLRVDFVLFVKALYLLLWVVDLLEIFRKKLVIFSNLDNLFILNFLQGLNGLLQGYNGRMMGLLLAYEDF